MGLPDPFDDGKGKFLGMVDFLRDYGEARSETEFPKAIEKMLNGTEEDILRNGDKSAMLDSDIEAVNAFAVKIFFEEFEKETSVAGQVNNDIRIHGIYELCQRA